MSGFKHSNSQGYSESTPHHMLYIIPVTSDQLNIFNAKQYNPVRAVLLFLYKFEAQFQRGS